MNTQEGTAKNNNNKRKKLRTLVLSPNVNDYNTGEYLYPNDGHDNYNDNKPDRMPVSNNVSYRFAYDKKRE
jgi:hypothetical protein